MADVDVLIIGAGPAGLAAATSARRAGATVRVLEASDESGGQFWRHLPATRPAGDEHRLHHQWQRYQQFRSAVDADPALTLDVGAHVWAIERRDDACARQRRVRRRRRDRSTPRVGHRQRLDPGHRRP